MGATDEFGVQAVDMRLDAHDVNATLLRLMGLDHEKLTYFYQGRDQRADRRCTAERIHKKIDWIGYRCRSIAGSRRLMLRPDIENHGDSKSKRTKTSHEFSSRRSVANKIHRLSERADFFPANVAVERT